MVKLLKRLRKKKTSYVEVDKHSKVKDAIKQWDNKPSNQNNKSLKEGDRERLSSLSTRSMSTFQRGEIPWTKNKERSTHQANRPTPIKEIHEPIIKTASPLAANQSPTNHSRRPFKMGVVPQVNKSRPVQVIPAKASREMEVHPPIIRETPKPLKKPANKFEEEALNAKYDLIPTKVRNAPFGRCYFARHRESKNVVLIALILQHVFDRFEGEHGEVQLIELMKSADPNLRGLREKIQCSGSVALAMDITLSEFSKSETMPVQNGARSNRSSDPSIALNGITEHAMDQRDEEDEIEDFMSELDSQSFPTSWTPKSASEPLEVDPRKKKINSEHFRKEAFSFETYEQQVEENRQDIKSNEKPTVAEQETRDPSGREESPRGQTYSEEVAKSRNERQVDHRNPSKKNAASPKNGRSRHRRGSETREAPDEKREMPEGSSRARRQKVRAQSEERRSEQAREKIRQRRQKELSERRRTRTGKKSSSSRGRERVEAQDSFSTNSSDTTSIEIRPVPPKNLTLWKLITSLELADCMPLAALDETMDFNYGRDDRSTSRRGRRLSRRNTFDTCESSTAY